MPLFAATLNDAQIADVLNHPEGAGCYGQNGADDAAADAVLLARAMAGRPIRLQWMREQEQYWEPYGPAMVAEVTGMLDVCGHVANWDYQVWSNVHTQRPGPAGVLLAAQAMEPPFPLPSPVPIPMPEGVATGTATRSTISPARR